MGAYDGCIGNGWFVRVKDDFMTDRGKGYWLIVMDLIMVPWVSYEDNWPMDAWFERLTPR